MEDGMAENLLQERLARETGHINAAIQSALARLAPSCRPVAEHIIAAGGKRMRPFLTILCARALGHTGTDIYMPASAMELLHAATLLHDDVLDDAEMRRGRKAAHAVYGPRAAILAGDALLALGNAIIADAASPAMSQCYSNATMNTAAGEILEMNSLHKPDLPLAAGLEIARGKTACLIGEACALGAIAAAAPPAAVNACRGYGENLGLAFQIVDDALDFAPEEQTGKPRAGDLREGKMTQPLRLYRESIKGAEREQFDRKFAAGSFSAAEIGHMAEVIAPFAGKSLELADSCLKKATEAIAGLPDCAERDALRQMAVYVRRRRN